MAFTYAKKNVRGNYVEFPEQLTEDMYTNLGSTYQDYLDNKWVLLSDDQLQFKSENPTASVKEVIEMQMTPAPARTKDVARSEKLNELRQYHYQHMRDFSYEGTDVWVEKTDRLVVKDAAEISIKRGDNTFEVVTDLQVPSDLVNVLMDAMTSRESVCNDALAKKQAEVESAYVLDTEEEAIAAIDAVVVADDYPAKTEVTESGLEAQLSENNKNDVMAQTVTLLSATVNSTFLDVDDATALACKKLYPEWASFIGKSLNTGMKVVYEDKLYKVRQEVPTVLENQFPSINTAALYEEINEAHEGTFADPIPYNNNMRLELNKYYIQDGVIYKCNRDSEQPVYNHLAGLVGIYVEVATA